MLVKKLQKLYYFIITPAFFIIFILFLSEKNNYSLIMHKGGRMMSTALMLFAAITSTIIPLWYKILMIRKFRNQKKISFETFAAYQYRIIIAVTFTLYWIFPAYLYQIGEMPMIITAFFALYALYYYYPTKKKIDAEKKLFKIDD